MIFGIGAATIDNNLFVNEIPEPNQKVRAHSFIRSLGGTMANALVTAKKFGVSGSLAGRVGQDAEGNEICSALSQAGVDCSFLLRQTIVSPRSTILVAADGTRTVISFRETCSGELPISLPNETTLLMVDHVYAETALCLLKEASERSIQSVGDMERLDTQSQLDCAGKLTHLIVSETTALTHATTCEDFCFSFWNDSKKVVAVTRGELGVSYSLDGQSVDHLLADKVAIQNTNGCGDVFHGAYAAALVKGTDVVPALRFANTAAGIKAGSHLSVSEMDFSGLSSQM